MRVKPCLFTASTATVSEVSLDAETFDPVVKQLREVVGTRRSTSLRT